MLTMYIQRQCEVEHLTLPTKGFVDVDFYLFLNILGRPYHSRARSRLSHAFKILGTNLSQINEGFDSTGSGD